MSDATRSSKAMLVGHAVSWVLACFFAVALVSAAVGALAAALGRPSLASNTPFTVAVEVLVHLSLAAAVFALVRRVARPGWYWAVAPGGYVAALAAFVAVMYLLGDTMAVPRGAGWAFVAGDIAATSLGAWLVLRSSRLGPVDLPSAEDAS